MKHLIDLLEIPTDKMELIKNDPAIKDIVNNYERSKMVWWKRLLRCKYDRQQKRL